MAGASRGVGRGLARGLGEAGATVIVTARSSETGRRTETRAEAIEDTAREVDAAGGEGHHYLCDHTSERAVDELVHWALRRFGRIDVAASSVWGGNEGYDGERYPDGAAWGTPFWRRSAEPFSQFLGTGPYPGLLLARAVAPAMVAARSGLIAFVSFGTEEGFLGDFYYDLAKATTNRLAFACAAELSPHGVCALSLSPGFVATERVRDLGQEALATESPLYAGRALAALSADPAVLDRAGRTVHVGDLARAYGFTDADGRQPERFRIGEDDA
ncbi:putative short-chain dehydrogenase/reductase SDR [Methylorubrum extorquens DM4]|uniref:Short-chain dehydrogenase/reductase SDR n=2 Tax=Methylorubrum extorquens TaxID=408 RepID=C5B0H2_METEA|nr:SDR family NAD(P)-dependent oxidoreductase [Methylorubrum zatmanii]ACS41559.1 putative short-chain dehydrogenase/reductase SDR [Methylorubrum extorquens AM1]KQQ04621.1 short-chain dehydrogenase [Methylobacterium sp. Leaf121]KQQ21484.1 short-chain dehydrogenase [Methylobacterium sp. Leaf122]CAX26223.1 putative short-chain dehydrogenase/reductase SDR [Methylorubrum extorquens DM4]ARO57253.1 short-chain dehydrogenase [Methylorubrum zatmanii]